jgi:hypothetical protein
MVHGWSKARIWRIVIGCVSLGLTLSLALPLLLAPDRPPPPPTALFVGLNAGGAGQSSGRPGSLLQLSIRASECKNPVTVEGLVERSSRTWRTDPTDPARPTEAEIVLAGARLSMAELGLSQISGAGSTGPQLAAGYEERIGDGAVRLAVGPFHYVTVHGVLSRVIADQVARLPAVYRVVLRAPEWPRVRRALIFRLRADLISPAGYNRCYINVPALFSSEPQWMQTLYTRTRLYGEGEGVNRETLARREPPSEEESPRSEIVAGDVSVSVSGRALAPISIGRGGYAVENTAHYSCQSYVDRKPPPNLDPAMFEETIGRPEYGRNANPNCSGTPMFESAGVSTDVTRRLFGAGIFGALAVTLIIEALLGKTELRRDVLRRAKRRRSRRS